jgi:hypothetical protein
MFKLLQLRQSHLSWFLISDYYEYEPAHREVSSLAGVAGTEGGGERHRPAEAHQSVLLQLHSASSHLLFSYFNLTLIIPLSFFLRMILRHV